ncbi:RNA polymerase-associated protein RapA [Pirellulimonas nuda]|uniref:RNA polymerase-associated protein RapA n=1 Tax=Pirellulimonas nuda TaxID=2528009 RepID=A0A518DA81_9BACT|nr:DISARM system SNF2-like helicase DrmD [Pirellulimonas nuda]QDU88394.1 RNA polymerase-associated protein RapA [Pirellulimonas nuda]
MATATATLPEQGQLVQLRSRQWVVNQIGQSTLPPSGLSAAQNAQHLLTLSSVEDDAIGEELQVVWEIEPGARVIERFALPDASGFDSPARLDAFLDAVRWGAASTADVRNIQAPFRSGIEIEDYQLDPVVRAIQMPRVNLLIADDVGLGKTIEAGLVALELIIRHRARRMLVVCPSALQVQWRDQMRDKFGLEFRIVDSAMMRELRRRRGIHANPWSHFPRLITSIDFLKRERPLRQFRETLPAPGEPVYPRKYDLLIVDEAHNCAPSGAGKYATDSLRTQALRELTPHFEHKLFLTATPHNGYRESFCALLELLDNQRFSRGAEPDRKQLDAVMVRRLRSDPSFSKKWDGTPRFPPRVLEPIEVPYTDEERACHAALREYTKLRSSRADGAAERFATEFVLKTLKKRLFSSPAAFLATLKRHEESLKTARRKKAAKPTISVLQRELDRLDEEYGDDDEFDQASDDALDSASRLFAEPTPTETGLLKQMKDWAEKASGQRDSKAKQLIAWLHDLLRPGGKWSAERVILFTEYRASQNWLQQQLATEGLGGDRLMTMHGGMDSDRREEVKAAFQASPAISPVRILLATDAASEGLDLQNHCSRLVHYEIPWNPNRMEQRNGRVDRHGQKAPKVQIYHFVGAGYQQKAATGAVTTAGDLEADYEFLMRVAMKIETIREDLGKVGPVIAQQVEEAMLGRRTTLQTEQAESEAQPIRRLLRFERDLQKQVQALMDQYRETRRELRLSPENIATVVQTGLELAGQPPLAPAQTPDGKPCFRLPPMKGSWAACSQGLEHPHTRDLRPITFDESVSRDRDDVVLVHLNHRLPQMCLRLLRAEVWAEKGRSKLQRVTARVIPNNLLEGPAAIAHARLVVIGGDCHRLHEEVIAAGGLIKEGKWGGRLKVGQLEAALAAAGPDEPPTAVQATLLELYPALAEPLGAALEARKKDRVTGLEKRLNERADKEAADIAAILTELKRSIETELDEPEYQQLELFTSPERDQFNRNKEAMRQRAREIPTEINRETAAIRARFADPQARMFPVAVTFLIPAGLA